MKKLIALLSLLTIMTGCAHSRINEYYEARKERLKAIHENNIKENAAFAETAKVPLNTPLVSIDQESLDFISKCKAKSKCDKQYWDYVVKRFIGLYKYSKEAIPVARENCQTEQAARKILDNEGFKEIKVYTVAAMALCYEIVLRKGNNDFVDKSFQDVLKELEDNYQFALKELEYNRYKDVSVADAQLTNALNGLSNNLNHMNTQNKLNQINLQNQQILYNQQTGR